MPLLRDGVAVVARCPAKVPAVRVVELEVLGTVLVLVLVLDEENVPPVPVALLRMVPARLADVDVLVEALPVERDEENVPPVRPLP